MYLKFKTLGTFCYLLLALKNIFAISFKAKGITGEVFQQVTSLLAIGHIL